MRWIVQEEINQKKKLEKIKSSKKTSYQSRDSRKIDWIEELLQTPIEDNRKYCLWRIIGPCLLNVRNLSNLESVRIMEEWLQKCDRLRKLDFEPRTKINSIIKSNKGYKPISFSKLKEENKELFLKPNLKSTSVLFN